MLVRLDKLLVDGLDTSLGRLNCVGIYQVFDQSQSINSGFIATTTHKK